MKVQLVFDLSYLSEFSLTAPVMPGSYGMSTTISQCVVCYYQCTALLFSFNSQISNAVLAKFSGSSKFPIGAQY